MMLYRARMVQRDSAARSQIVEGLLPRANRRSGVVPCAVG